MGNKIIFSQDEINKMINMHNNGILHKDIANCFNVSRSTIDRKLREANIPSRHPWLNNKRKQTAIDLYSEYHNLSKVSKILKMSEITVKNILLENNIHIYDMSEVKKTKRIDEHFFDIIDSHRKAYYLGLLYADGTVNSKTNCVQISLQEQDKDILFKFREDLKSDYKISKIAYNDKNPNWQNQYYISITNNYIHDALIKYGMIPNKSLNLIFPTILDEQYYNSFILGYIDGDGHFSKNPKDKRISLISTNSFCQSVAKIVKEKFDIHCSIMLCHGNDKVPTRTLQIAGNNQVKTFLDWIYSDCDIYLERKFKIYQELYCIA